jgi:hypothetical protein
MARIAAATSQAVDVRPREIAFKLEQLIRNAPAGGIFHDAVTGRVRSFIEVPEGQQSEAKFGLFFAAGLEYDVTVTPR